MQKKYIPLYINSPGTIIMIEGTVSVIRGKPINLFIPDARRPAVNDAIKETSWNRIFVLSKSVRRRIFDTVPISPAKKAI